MLDPLLKRLQIIKNLVILGDASDVDAQLGKLEALQMDEAVFAIVRNIRNKEFGEAVRMIEAYITEKSHLVVYSDPEIAALKIELSTLENDMAERLTEKAEIEKLIHDFNARYNKFLGRLIEELLRLKKEKLKKDNKADPKKRKEYEEAEQDYQSFHKTFEDTKKQKLFELSKDEKEEIKQKYRIASKLCHPDMVADDMKQQAKEVFIDLQKAYSENDIEKVSDILEMLQQGLMFVTASESITDKKKLKGLIKRLRTEIDVLMSEIEGLRQNDTYRFILGIPDWDKYFAEIKEQLEGEIKRFRQENAR